MRNRILFYAFTFVVFFAKSYAEEIKPYSTPEVPQENIETLKKQREILDARAHKLELEGQRLLFKQDTFQDGKRKLNEANFLRERIKEIDKKIQSLEPKKTLKPISKLEFF